MLQNILFCWISEMVKKNLDNVVNRFRRNNLFLFVLFFQIDFFFIWAHQALFTLFVSSLNLFSNQTMAFSVFFPSLDFMHFHDYFPLYCLKGCFKISHQALTRWSFMHGNPGGGSLGCKIRELRQRVKDFNQDTASQVH